MEDFEETFSYKNLVVSAFIEVKQVNHYRIFHYTIQISDGSNQICIGHNNCYCTTISITLIHTPPYHIHPTMF